MSSSTYNPVITLTSLSTQQGEINLVTNPIAQTDVSNWTTSSATLTRSTTGVLSPVIATGFTASSTTSTTSYVQTSLLTVPATLRNRKLKVQLYIQCADTATWKVDVLKSDGSTRHTLSTDVSGVSALPALTGTYTTTFDMDTGSGIYVRLTRYAGSGTSTLSFTNLIVGPGIQPQGAVAQEWQSYTPTFEGLGTVTNASGRYRRVGDSIQVEFVATSGVNTAVLLNTILPISLNWDSTKLFNNANVGKFNTNQTPFSGGILAYTSQGTTKVSLVADNASILAGSVGTAWANSTTFSGTFTIPIAEWTGSGTVQLAQNDVEYAWNSDPGTTAGTTYSNSTYYGYGPNGTSIPAIASTTTTGESKTVYTVVFQTPVQATDQVVIELNDGNGWFNAAQRFPPFTNNAASYGVLLIAINSTTYRVAFGNAGYGTSGATTYGAAGGAWSGVTSWRWRVRKSSAGAAVGFGVVQPGVSSGLVSASGVPGNTTGNTIASGYVGQIVSNHFGSVNFASAAWANFGSITLTSGLWLVFGSVAGDRNGATLSVFNLAYSIMANGDTSAYSTKYNLRTSTQINVTSSVSWDSFVFSTPSFYVRSDGTNLYFGDGSTLIASSQQLTMYGYIGTFSVATPFAKGKIEAIRIA